MEELKKHLSTLTQIIPVIYFIGFITMNGYLSQFGFSDTDILNTSYLKSGILYSLFLFFIAITIFLSYSNYKPTDNFKEVWPVFLASYSNLLLLYILITLQCIDPNLIFIYTKKQGVTLILTLGLYLLFRIFASGEKLKKRVGVFFLILPQIILLLIASRILCNIFEIAIWLFYLIMGLGTIILVSVGLIGDKIYKERLFSDLIIFIVSAFIFGRMIYDKIPHKFGGGKPYMVVLNSSEIKLNTQIAKQHLDTFNVLYENSDRYLIKDKKMRILFIRKSDITSFQIIPPIENKYIVKF